jgi:hypothetical protein
VGLMSPSAFRHAGLMDRPWNTAVAYLPGGDGNRLAVGTAEYKVRLYDTRQRRPTADIKFKDARITALAPEPQGRFFCQCLLVISIYIVILRFGSVWALRALVVAPTAPAYAAAQISVAQWRFRHASCRG